MNSGKNLVRLAAAVMLAGIVGGCTHDRPITTAPQSDPTESTRLRGGPPRLPHGRASVAWVGDFHTEAMQRWMRGRSEFALLRREGACAGALQLARAFLPDVKRATGHATADLDAVFEHAIEGAGVRAGCDEPAVPPSVLSASAFAALVPADDSVTGAYEQFIPRMESALGSATSPDQVAAAVDQVLSQASSLPEPDFEVLAAVASLESSSAWYWYEYGAGGTDGGTQPTLVFEMAGFSWLEFAKADLEGAIAGVGLARAVGAVHPYLLAAALFGGAAIGSGMYAYQNME
jgi:hypothetical protein